MSIKLYKNNLVITVSLKKLKSMMSSAIGDEVVLPTENTPLEVPSEVSIENNDIQPEVTTDTPMVPPQETGGDTPVQQ